VWTGAELAEAFSESDFPFKVDIVDWATTSERFREVIRGEYVLLPTDPSASAWQN